MERLFSPWRSSYIESFKKPSEGNGCVFCNAFESTSDEENLVIWRGKLAFVVMNKYPYNSGHMMVIPIRHTSDFLSLTAEEFAESMHLLQTAHKALTELSTPQGYNIGANLGRTAGAGIEDHLHWHIVPRWNGDTNFLPTLADVKLVSEDMTKQRQSLHGFFKKNLGQGE
jgi:ATP adenylyltransferase